MNISYAKVATKILKYLNGLELNIESLNTNRLGISDRQYYQTLKMLTDDGYIKGIEFLDVIPPEMSQINHPRSWYIIQYLEENSLIRKAYNTLKEAKDWLPLMYTRNRCFFVYNKKYRLIFSKEESLYYARDRLHKLKSSIIDVNEVIYNLVYLDKDKR